MIAIIYRLATVHVDGGDADIATDRLGHLDHVLKCLTCTLESELDKRHVPTPLVATAVISLHLPPCSSLYFYHFTPSLSSLTPSATGHG
jgi:hypothetical protein